MMTFAKTFGCKPEIQTVANGRVNLIGEHTDYNGGFVLPTSIPQTTRVQLCRREDDMVRLATGNFEGPATEYRLGEEARNKTWTDYVQGCTWVLAREFAAKSAQFCGFDMAIESEVPMGSGLSSSAALEVAVLKAIVEAWRLREEADDMRIAQLSQKVENEFVGARVGIMDPVAAALAQEGTAIFLDTRFLKFEKIEIPSTRWTSSSSTRVCPIATRMAVTIKDAPNASEPARRCRYLSFATSISPISRKSMICLSPSIGALVTL